MPLLADRVRETSATTGTGTLTLAGAVAGYQGFNAAFANADTVYYVIQYATEWEVGIGTVGTGTLSRDSVLASSNADALVPFSAGTKDVFVAYVAERAVTTSDAATLTNKTIDDYTNNVGANSTHFRVKASGSLSKGTVVKASGFVPGEQAITVVAVASASDIAIGVMEQTLTSGQFGMAVVIGELFDVNTNAFAFNDVLYSNGAGGLTATKPASGLFQTIGTVVRSNANNGVIAVNIVAPMYVEASTNTANTGVLRDGSGNFAAGTVTAALTGNASTATALATARNINGVSFNGSADITVTAAAGTLSGSTLASGVTASSLTSVGTLSSLAVSGTATVGKVSVTANTVAGNGMYLPTSNTLAFSTNDTERARIDVLGRFGLGVTPSAWVNRSVIESTYGGALSFDQVQVQTALSSNCFYDGTNWIYKLSSFAPTRYELGDAGTGNGTHRWFSAAAGTAGNTITFAERMRIDASGNLGLGVTPSAWSSSYTAMQIRGLSLFGSTSDSEASIGGNVFVNTSGQYAYRANTLASVYQQVNGTHAWLTAPSGTAGNAISFTQALTLHASGGHSLGTTTDPGAGVFLANTGVEAPRLSTATATSFGSALAATAYRIYADATYGAAIAGFGTSSDVTLIGRGGNLLIQGTDSGGAKLGFFGTAPQAKPTVTGSRGANAALTNLLTVLANLGLLTDSTT